MHGAIRSLVVLKRGVIVRALPKNMLFGSLSLALRPKADNGGQISPFKRHGRAATMSSIISCFQEKVSKGCTTLGNIWLQFAHWNSSKTIKIEKMCAFHKYKRCELCIDGSSQELPARELQKLTKHDGHAQVGGEIHWLSVEQPLQRYAI